MRGEAYGSISSSKVKKKQLKTKLYNVGESNRRNDEMAAAK
jgi:hypothetical protein